MANELLAQALDECSARRIDNESEEQRRLAHASGLSPAIARLEDERRGDILRGLRQAIEGIKPEGIVERTAMRNREIKKLLLENGLPGDYLEPVHQCPVCHDSGYTGSAAKSICGCVTKRYHELLSGSNDTKDSPSFERFNPGVFSETPLDSRGTTQRMLMDTIYNRCEQYADSLPEGPLNLVLFGPSGLGKTYLLKSIAQRAGEHGFETMAFTANALLNHIREAYFARGEEVAQPYYDVPLLLIDDLGTEPLWENITLEQLFNLLAYRMENRKHTVFSTNLPLKDLKKRYTMRIYSRLMDRKLSLALEFQGHDIRLTPKG
jgi:DNA replication protein DnaC